MGPYVGGVGGSCETYIYSTRITNGAVELLGGLDLRLTPSVDLRAIGYGAAAAGASSANRTGFGFLDAGVVYHFSHGGTKNP